MLHSSEKGTTVQSLDNTKEDSQLNRDTCLTYEDYRTAETKNSSCEKKVGDVPEWYKEFIPESLRQTLIKNNC